MTGGKIHGWDCQIGFVWLEEKHPMAFCRAYRKMVLYEAQKKQKPRLTAAASYVTLSKCFSVVQ